MGNDYDLICSLIVLTFRWLGVFVIIHSALYGYRRGLYVGIALLLVSSVVGIVNFDHDSL